MTLRKRSFPRTRINLLAFTGKGKGPATASDIIIVSVASLAFACLLGSTTLFTLFAIINLFTFK